MEEKGPLSELLSNIKVGLRLVAIDDRLPSVEDRSLSGQYQNF